MSIKKAAMWTMGSQYIVFAVQFIVGVIVSRYFLTPSEIGLFSIALAAAMMISVLQDFGISRYVIASIDLTRDVIRACSSVSFIFGLIVAGLIFITAYPISRFYGEPHLLRLFIIIGMSYLIAPFSIVPVALLSKEMNFKAIFVVNCGGAITNGAVMLVLAWQGFSADSLAWAMLAQAFVRAILAQFFSPAAIPFPLHLKDAMPIARFGSASTALAISGSIGIRSPDLVVGRFLGTESVGLYSRASALAGQFHMLVLGAVGSIFFPAFAKLRDEGQPFGPHYERIVAAYGAIVWPAMILLAAAAQPIVLFLYGEKWAEAGLLLSFLALAELFFCALPLHMDIPILMGRIKTLIWFNMLDTLASIGTLIIASHWSIEAAAASRIVYGALWYCVYARLMHGLTGFRWRIILGIYGKSIILAVTTALPLLLAYRFWLPPEQIGFIHATPFVALGLALWFSGLFVLKHPARTEIMGMITHIAGLLPRGRLRHRPE